MHNDVVHVLTPLYEGAQNSPNANIILTLLEGGYVLMRDMIWRSSGYRFSWLLWWSASETGCGVRRAPSNSAGLAGLSRCLIAWIIAGVGKVHCCNLLVVTDLEGCKQV